MTNDTENVPAEEPVVEPASAAPSCVEELTSADYEVPLTEDEQREIAFQLGPLLAGAGLLGLGFVFGLLYPDQKTIAAAIQAVAALIVSFPIFQEGVRGFLANPPVDLTEQLVTLAILAAMAQGDFTTATLVPLFLELGHLFEERSSRGARAAIDGIRKLHATKATKWLGGAEREVDPDELQQGDRVVVRPGEVIPVDGEVEHGYSSVDQAPITGESVYEDVEPGSRVFSGTVNLGGLIRVRATDVGGRSVLGRVLNLLKQVEESKTPALRLLEKYAGVYLPIVLTVAAVTLFVTTELDRAITVLIVACPCALVIAGPAAMVAAMTASTRQNILIKSASFLEMVADVDTLVLDKTGTVTAGMLSIERVRPVGGAHEEEVLRAAATCGHGSLHPVSRAVVDEAKHRGVEGLEASEIHEEPGEGVVAKTAYGTFRLGRASWLERNGLVVREDGADAGPGAWVARDREVLGHISLVDRPRAGAKEALLETRRLGIEQLVLLTGDKEDVARSVSEELEFDRYVAEVLPEQKLDLVREIQDEGRRVMMVGDGVNDALALSGADVGVAVGGRINEVALGGADVALMTVDLDRLPRMMRLADRTRTIVMQNAVIGTGFSILMMGLASGGLVNPLVGALFHNLGSLFVIMNSSRLMRMFDPAPTWRDVAEEAAPKAPAVTPAAPAVPQTS